MDQIHPREHYFSNKPQFKKNQSQNQLNLKPNQDGIIRLHGRFINANLPEDEKLSILLRG